MVSGSRSIANNNAHWRVGRAATLLSIMQSHDQEVQALPSMTSGVAYD
jgi:hypothetical protein